MKIEQVNLLTQLIIERDNTKKLIDRHRIEPLYINIFDKSESVDFNYKPNQETLNQFLNQLYNDYNTRINLLINNCKGGE